MNQIKKFDTQKISSKNKNYFYKIKNLSKISPIEKTMAQGAIEYLLILGSAVIVAVIVIALLMNLVSDGKTAADDADISSAYEGLMGVKDKHKGIMTVTLSFKEGANNIKIPNGFQGGSLEEVFNNAPNQTTIKKDDETATKNDDSWMNSFEINAGDELIITVEEDSEFETSLQIPNNSLIPINTCAKLQSINNNLSKDYELITNIDCFNYTFTPIGIIEPFNGTLEGNDFNITQLTINTEDNPLNPPTGLFSKTTNATIKNIKMGGYSISGSDEIGIFVGNTDESTIITNCKNNGGRLKINGNYTMISPTTYPTCGKTIYCIGNSN
jgi:hypothetical protein